MNETAPLPVAPPPRRNEPPAIPPLVPVLMPLVVTAIILGVLLAVWFPGAAHRPPPVARFTDITASAGLDWPPPGPGATPEPSTLGGAVVVLDYDNDGSPDLFFVNAGPWPWEQPLAKEPGRSSCLLFHNDGHGRFIDVTARAGLDVPLLGMAAAAGDFDNDGYVDLFVTCVGMNHLYRNRGDGTFEDVTDRAGVGGDSHTWSTGATWIDVDGDGKLDLVVAHYARWPEEVGLHLAMTVAKMGRSYGTPAGFISADPSVYRNLGDGRFARLPGGAGLRDVDPQTGRPMAEPLAVAPVDANDDGRLDLLFSYAAGRNALFLNQGDGTFRKWAGRRDDRQEGAAAALASSGTLPFGPRADGRLVAFDAAAERARERPPDGTLDLAGKLEIARLDYALTGDLACFSGEARAEQEVNRVDPDRNYAAAPALWWRDAGTWIRAKPGIPSGWARPLLARGVAVADIDGDGDPDVIIAQHDRPPRLLRNDQRLGLPWLRIRLVATRTAEEAGGARVEVHTPRRVLVQTVAPAMGFMAQSESILTFGLGEDARVRRVVIHWPSGQRQELAVPAVDRTLVVKEP